MPPVRVGWRLLHSTQDAPGSIAPVGHFSAGGVVRAGLFATLPVAICGIVRAETLHGAKNAADHARLRVFLGQFTQVPIPDAIWDAVGNNLYTLRTNGVTLPFANAVLATVAIVNDLELWPSCIRSSGRDIVR